MYMSAYMLHTTDYIGYILHNTCHMPHTNCTTSGSSGDLGRPARPPRAPGSWYAGM